MRKLTDPIDWTNPECEISTYFTVKEAIFLPKWNRLASEGDGLTTAIEYKLMMFFNRVMDPVRVFFGDPIRVHCAYRPPHYNAEIGGAKDSAHMALGDWAACDFDVEGITCGVAGALLLPRLQSFGCRMENNGETANWIHLDTRPIVNSRYFKP